jgi:hypothetical protein
MPVVMGSHGSKNFLPYICKDTWTPTKGIPATSH